jgi:hypothetical protein
VASEFGEDQQARIAELIDLTPLQLDELVDVWCDLETLVASVTSSLGCRGTRVPSLGRRGSPARSICLDLRR